MPVQSLARTRTMLIPDSACSVNVSQPGNNVGENIKNNRVINKTRLWSVRPTGLGCNKHPTRF